MKGVVMKNVLAVIGLPLLVGFTLRAGILTHEFKVEEFGNINMTDKDIVVFIHGIYGKLDDLSYIKGKLEEKGYAGISIQLYISYYKINSLFYSVYTMF